jgi:hypothetical protein
VLDMNRYQWTVLFAAWLGWGFDVFDGLLFNFVAPNCVPDAARHPAGHTRGARGDDALDRCHLGRPPRGLGASGASSSAAWPTGSAARGHCF